MLVIDLSYIGISQSLLARNVKRLRGCLARARLLLFDELTIDLKRVRLEVKLGVANNFLDQGLKEITEKLALLRST